MKSIYRFLFTYFLLLCLSITSGSAQELFSGVDLPNINIDKVSDADIIKYNQQLQSAGISQAQAEEIALSKGMPAAEIAKLRQRLSLLVTAKNTPASTGSTSRTVNNSNETSTGPPGITDPRVFGSELFTTSSLTFQPDLKIATPMNYVLGPDDELQIAVSGLQEAAFNLTVSPEGTIFIPNVGPVRVSGQTFEGATTAIRSRMGTIYTSLRSGASKLSVSLGRIRSIRVTILGAAKPGTYTVSSLSTLFNALYIAGGPSPDGTFRAIELIRNNKVEKRVDLYNFLLSGSDEDNVRLRENDIIRIPVYKNRVEITGLVKRQGIFEMLPGETVNDLLRYASGFRDNAYKASIKVTQLTDKERSVKDLPASEFGRYQPSTGDAFVVSEILNRFANRVTINGAVFRPGVFELTENLTVGNLIRRADGLREDAYTGRARIIRVREDLTTELIPFDVKDVLAGRNDIQLRREDVVSISSIFELRDEFTVSIQGEVRKPGGFKFIDVLTLKDLIVQAGGFTDAAYPQRIEIARVIRRDTLTKSDTRLSEIIEIADVNDLSLASKNIALQPFDVVTVRRMPGYLGLESVEANGQFQFPGPYVLQKRAERVSDLIRRAGGLSPEAFPDGAYLRRKNEVTMTTGVEAERVDRIQRQLKDTSGLMPAAVVRPYDQIAIDLTRIIANPGSEADMVLKPGDVLFVPRNDREIKITGEVLFPTQATYSRNNNLKDYVDIAGGFTDNSRKKRIYVLYPNGKAGRTRSFLFFRSYPEVRPGAEIIVPNKAVKVKKNTTADTAIIASVLASIAGIVIALTQLFR